MSCNLHTWDRIMRWVLGILILGWAIAGGPSWAYPLGVYAIVTASWAWCPLYFFFL